MEEVDLSSFQIRTDLVADLISNLNDVSGIDEELKEIDGVKISNIKINSKGEKLINKKKGLYTTIYFDDVTDHNNRKKVLNIFIEELKSILSKSSIKDNDSCLIIGLGNDKSTPDSLGVKSAERVIVTKHIYDLTNHLEEGFRISSSFIPGVMGTTGIETSDILINIIEVVKPDFVIVIDALASDSIDRVCKTIQISNTGIAPGSGIGNKRKEITKEIIGVPVISIGVPMVVDAVTIVSDTINFMIKHFSYNLKNINNEKNKMIPFSNINYLLEKDLSLTSKEKKYFLGMIGTLSDFEMKALIFDVLTPIGYNLMVTPKEVDFLIGNLSFILGEGINKSIHNI